jgi:multidrug resistance protein MdtO
LKQPAVAGFALKISLCATLCYIAYHALGWPGISTATVTVLLTAAGHSGAIKQKLMYRLLGSAIGGLLFGIGCTAFVFPLMDSIFSLTLLVGAIAFIAAWWAGGRRLSYVGLQIAFSFYLVAFEGVKAPTDLTPPRDRLVGILVALIVMWFVFDQIWPTRTITAMRRTLAGILGAEAKMFRVFDPAKSRTAMLREVDALRDQVGKAVASLRTMNDAAQFEYGQDLGLTIQAGDTILQAALSAVGLFWNQIAVLHSDKDFLDEPRLIVLRQSIADRMDALSGAVARKLPAPVIDLASLEHPRYGDYTRNAVNRFGELQTTLAGLGVAI